MKSPWEWVREGNPDYLKNKRKGELRTQISERQERLDHVTMMRGTGAEQRDMRDPEDARLIDRLTSEIEALKGELQKFETAD